MVVSAGAVGYAGCGSDSLPALNSGGDAAVADSGSGPSTVDAARTCATGQSLCGGNCVDMQLDRDNCGACGTKCAASEVCSQGACGLSCGGGTTKCGANCTDTKVDEKNCGACGTTCGAGQICSGGDGGTPACVCASGMTNCNGTCVDMQTDNAHCGACTTACTGTQDCVTGACKGPISEWRFEDNLNDQTTANNGTAEGAITYVTPSWGQSRGKAARFNGAMSVLVNAPTNLPLGNAPRTTTAWVRSTGWTDPTYNGILSYGTRGPQNESWVLSYRSGGSLQVTSANWSNDLTQTLGNGLATNMWSHVAFTWDGSSRHLYANGIEVATDNTTPLNTVLGALRLAATDNPGRRMVGDLDDVRMYDYARTPAQIARDANTDVFYAFASATDTVDSGPNATTAGTKTGAITATADRKGAANSALAFDGAAGTYFAAGPFFQLATANRPYTVMTWVKGATPMGDVVHLSSAADGTGWCETMLGIDSTGHPVANSWTGGGTSVVATNPVAANTWTHLATTWSNNSLKLYVNGVLAASLIQGNFSASGVATGNTLTVGNHNANGVGCYHGNIDAPARIGFAGSIDDVKVFGRALSASEIATAMDN